MALAGWHNERVGKRQLTVDVDEELLRALDDAAGRTRRSRAELVEEALAHQVASGALDRIWSTVDDLPLADEEATQLAYAELRAARAERGTSGTSS